MTSWITLGAAKLNLTLEVLGKRDDGFHDLASIAVSLDLADEIRLTVGGEDRSISYQDDNGRPVSIETSDDIIARAWSELDTRCPLPTGGAVEVVKRIPLTSGLGGGSTDAAAFLRLARRAWGLPLRDLELCEIGARVGSDVPVCLLGGTVRMAGRGERVTPVSAPIPPDFDWVVLLHRPEIPVPAAKTAAMYRSLRPTDFRLGDATESLQRVIEQAAVPTQADCVNSFDRPAREVFQGLTPAWRTMGAAIARSSMALGAEPVTPLLAGAGPTLFALLRPDIASAAADQLRGSPGFTYVARILSRDAAAAVERR